jgi:tRNA(Ser,Leu) C12 N-acetylase TAN1
MVDEKYMIEYIKFRKKLSKLHKMRDSTYESYAEDIRKAREQIKPSLEIKKIESDARFDDQEISETISTLVTNVSALINFT